MSYSLKTNFTSGELSTRMDARIDVSKHQNGCRTMRNCYTLPHGPVIRRSGTKYIAEVKDSDKAVRIIPFEFSEEQAYILELGDLYTRVYKDQGQVVVASATGYAQWLTTTAYVVGDNVKEAGVNYQCLIGHTSGTFSTDLAAGKWKRDGTAAAWVTSTVYAVDDYVDESSTVYRCVTGHTSGTFSTDLAAGKWVASDLVEITNTYLEAELFNLRYCQSADSLYITHYDHAPATLTRTGHSAWTLADISFTAAPSSWAAADYPSCVNFFEQRLCFAANRSNPQTIWMSTSADYYNFTLPAPLTDDSPCIYTISADFVNVIKWISPSEVLALGTNGGEWVLSGGSGDVVTPTSVRVVRQSTYGSQDLQPILAGSINLFVQKPGKVVREFVYSFDQDRYKSVDLSILAEHLFRSNNIVDWAYQQTPHSIIWAVRDDGKLLGLTYLRQHEVVGWHIHDTEGFFESVAVIPGTDRDEVYFVVKRTVNGVTKRYIELLEAEYNPGTDTDATNAFMVDCGLTYSGAAATTISGLDHLEGETVSILADGKVVPDQVVASGAITLSTAAEVVHVGLPYITDIEPMPLDIQAAQGVSMGLNKRIISIKVLLEDSVGGKIGKSATEIETMPPVITTYGAAPLLFSGYKDRSFPEGYDKDATVFIRQDQPLPLLVKGLTIDMEVTD